MTWGVGVITRNEEKLRVYDSIIGDRTFQTVYPRLLLWANLLGSEYGNQGWCRSHRIEDCSTTYSMYQSIADSPFVEQLD